MLLLEIPPFTDRNPYTRCFRCNYKPVDKTYLTDIHKIGDSHFAYLCTACIEFKNDLLELENGPKKDDA